MSQKPIQYLPPGWVWVYADEHQAWTTGKGNVSYERHGHNTLTGENLSTRQIQNRQREARSQAGTPKAPTIPRTGKTRTIVKNKGHQYGGFGSEEIGEEQKLVFRTLDDARNYVAQYGVPDGFKSALIQVRYSSRLKGPARAGTTRDGKEYVIPQGYATLTRYIDAEGNTSTLVDDAIDATTGSTQYPNVWNQAAQKITDFDMTGKNARVYLYFTQRG